MNFSFSEGRPVANGSNLDVMNDSLIPSTMNNLRIGLSNDQLMNLDEYNLRPTDHFNHHSAGKPLHEGYDRGNNILAKVDNDDDIVVGMEILVLPQQLAIEDTIGDAVTFSQEDPEDESTFDDFGTSQYILDTNFHQHTNKIPPDAFAKLIFDQISGNPLYLATAAELVEFFEEDQSMKSS
jgi:hypothetical protein